MFWIRCPMQVAHTRTIESIAYNCKRCQGKNDFAKTKGNALCWQLQRTYAFLMTFMTYSQGVSISENVHPDGIGKLKMKNQLPSATVPMEKSLSA